MAREVLLSAKFKRDYVATFAVVIFCMIVVAEVALAVSIPAYLERENVMALQMSRIRLRESFDGVRRQAARVRAPGELGELELKVVSSTLNQLADYLREYSGKLSADEIKQMQDQINRFSAILGRLNSGRPFCVEQKLDASAYLNSFLPPEYRSAANASPAKPAPAKPAPAKPAPAKPAPAKP